MVKLEKWLPFRFPRQNRRNADLAVRNPGGKPLSLTTLHDEMERMFERFWTDPMAAIDTRDRWFGDFSQMEFQPKLDVTDDKDFLRVTLEVPGVDEKDLDVEVQDGIMTIRGEKKQEETREDEGCYHTERSYGFFHRTIPLPAEVETGKAEAKFRKGILTVKLPKTEKAKQLSTKIPIKA